MYLDVVGGHSTQQVKSEGDTVQAVDAADTEIFTKLSTHQLSEKGAYIHSYVCSYIRSYVHTSI